MKTRHLLIGLLIVFHCCANQAWSQGTISWTSGYPQTNGCEGIDVKGIVQLDNGWTLTSDVTVWAWQDGGELQLATFAINCGSWEGQVTGLTSDATYNLVVFVDVTDGCVVQTLAIEPRTSKAK